MWFLKPTRDTCADDFVESTRAVDFFVAVEQWSREDLVFIAEKYIYIQSRVAQFRATGPTLNTLKPGPITTVSQGRKC